MSRRDRAVDRDADEAAVRDEVDEFLAGLTQTWSSTGVDARATTRPDSPVARSSPWTTSSACARPSGCRT